MKKILIISFKNIAALNDGAKIVSYSFLKQLSQNYNVKFVNILDEGEYKNFELERLQKLNIEFTLIHENENTSVFDIINSIWSKSPLVFVRKKNRFSIREELKQIVNSFQPESIVWDHSRTLAYFDDSFFYLNNYLIEHNDEVDLLIQRSNTYKNPIKYFVKLQASFLKKQLEKFYDSFKKIIFISSYDLKNIKELPQNFCLLKKINLFFEHKEYFIKKRNKFNLIFIGTLDWFPNIEGLNWFVNQVLPKVNADCNLMIVGRNPVKELYNLESDKVKIYPNVKSIEDYIQDADIFISPMLSGGGINIKILEALSYGIPIVGTSHSFRGYEHIDFLKRCDNPEEFANQINYLCINYNERENLIAKELEYYNNYKKESENELLNALEK